jgi:hypothetical protein
MLWTRSDQAKGRQWLKDFFPAPRRVWMRAAWVGVGLLGMLLFGLLRGFGEGVSLASSRIPISVPADLVARNQALLERDAELLASMAAGRLDAILDPMFADYHRHVPDFAAWAFQWRTSYALLRRGVVTAITLPFADPPRLQRFGEAWDELIAAKFDELVLRPEGGITGLRGARNRWESEIQPILDAVVTDALLTAALLRGQDPSPRTWKPVVANETTNNEAIPLLAAIGAASHPIKVHAVRPLLTRLTIRPPVAAAVTAAGEALSSYGNLAFLGSVSGLVATVGGFLSIDYLISRADAAIHQQALEVEIHRVLDTEHEDLRQSWLVAIQPDIDIHLARARKILGGKMAKQTASASN